MKWTIRVRPIDENLSGWVWTAEREDGETALRGSGRFGSQEVALEAARAEVRKAEAAYALIEENSLTEEYIPTEAEILAALPAIKAPEMPMLRLETP